jgi:4-amino-4-deoxy-L-arabinose transferase-like glycosyltransferase
MLSAIGMFAIIFFLTGVMVFKGGRYFNGYMLIQAGVLAALALFWFLNKLEEMPYVRAEYIHESILLVALKSVAAALLLFLAMHYMYSGARILGSIVYFFFVMQAGFIFRRVRPKVTASGLEKAKIPEKTAGVPANGKRTLFAVVALCFAAASFILLAAGKVKFGIVAFGLSALVFGFTGTLLAPRENADSGFFEKNKWYFLFGAVALGAGLRLFNLHSIPPGYHYDTRRVFDIVRRMAAGENFGVFLSDPDLQVGSLYYYVVYYFMHLTGIQISAIRIVSSITGVIDVALVFLIAKRLFGGRVAALAGILSAVSFIQILFSRLDSPFTLVVTFSLLSIYFILRAFESGSPLDFAFSGFFTALNMFTYNSGKAIVPVLGLMFMYLLVSKKEREALLKNWRGILIFVIVFFAVFWPMLQFIIKYFPLYTERLNNFNYWRRPDMNSWYTFVSIIESYALSFTAKGSVFAYSNLPGRQVFGVLDGIMFLSGLAYIFVNWRDKRCFFILSWLILAFLPGVFSVHVYHPYYGRALISLPVLAMICAVGIDILWRAFESKAGYMRAVIPAAVVLIIAIPAISNVKDYFTVYPVNKGVMEEFEYGASRIENIVMDNKGQDVFVSPFFLRERPFFCFPCADAKYRVLDVSAFELPWLYNNEKKDALIISEGINAPYGGLLKEYFPDVVIDERKNTEKMVGWIDQMYPDIRFEYFRIPYRDIEALFSLQLSVPGAKETVRFTGPVFVPGPTGGAAELSGGIYVSDYGDYRFFCDGNGSAVFFVDGAEARGPVKLYKGIHRFKVAAKARDANGIKLMWENIRLKNPAVIEARYFLNTSKVFGLLANYEGNGAEYKILDPILYFRIFNNMQRVAGQTPPDHYKITWNGRFQAEISGEYKFEMDDPPTPDFDCAVYMDGVKVFSMINGIKTIKPCVLSGGAHVLRAESKAAIYAHDAVYFRLMYAGPGKNDFVYVPYNMITPAR